MSSSSGPHSSDSSTPRSSHDPSFWLDVGRGTASAYLSRKDWLYRRVETYEYVSRGAFRRRVSVDFEIPQGLPDLRDRAQPGGNVVPVSVFQKWPPLASFDLVGPDGLPASLYLRDTNKELDLGLVIGMAEQVCGDLSERVRSELATKVIAPSEPPSHTLEPVIRRLSRELLDAVRGAEDADAQSRAARHAQETINLAAQLANSSVLWVPVVGAPGTDSIIKFSYLDPWQPLPASWWRRFLIGCGWWEARHAIWLPHAGAHSRYHFEVLPKSPALVLTRAEVVALPGPRIEGPSPAAETAPTDYAELRFDGAVIYRGYRAAPSPRMFLRLTTIPNRSGFITGCAIFAVAVALLLTAAFARLAQTDSNLDATVVLLAAVPAILAYVVIRTGETELERYQLTGIRKMALLSGLLPIIGALILVLTRKPDRPYLTFARPEWAALVILSWFLATGLAITWLVAMTPETAERSQRRRMGARIAPRAGLGFGILVALGATIEVQPYSHVARNTVTSYLQSNELRVVAGATCIALGQVALYAVIAGLWRIFPRAGDNRRRSQLRTRFIRLILSPGLAWIWAMIAVQTTTAWQALALGNGPSARLPGVAHAVDIAANCTLVPAMVFVIATSVWLVWPRRLVQTTGEFWAVLIALVAAVAGVGVRGISLLWPSLFHFAALWPWLALAAWGAVVATVPRVTDQGAG